MSLVQLLLRCVGWVLSAALNAVLAYLCLRPLRTERASLNAALWLFLFVFVTSLFIMVAGLFGMLTAASLTVASLLGWVVVLLVPSWRQLVLSAPSQLRQWGQSAATFWRFLPGWVKVFTGAVAVVSSVRFLFLIWALPPFVWDSLTYHLTNVAHWVQVGRIEVWDTPMVRIYSPANYEVLAAWFAVFLHHDAIIEAAGLPAYALAVASVYALGRSLGVKQESAWLGAMAYAVTPALLLPTTGTKNDPHMAAYYLLLAALLADNVFNKESSNERPLRKFVAIFLVLSLAFGTKTYLIQMLPGLAVLVGVGAWWRRRDWDVGGFVDRFRVDIRRTGSDLKVGLVLLLLAGLFLGAYWNLRNWFVTGNPFYPYGVSLGGREIWEGPQSEAGMNVGNLIENVQLIAVKLGDRLAPIRQDLTDTTGWGWFVYVLGLPASAWVLWQEKRLRLAVCGFVVSLAFVLMATPPDPWNMRYIIWFPAVFCLGFAIYWDALAGSWPWLKTGFAMIYVATVALSLASVANYGQVRPEEFAGMLAKPVWARGAAAFHETVPQGYETALDIVPQDARLGYNVIDNGFIYPLYRADFSQRLVFVQVSSADTCRAIAGRMARKGTRYLFVAPVHTPDGVIAKLRACADEGTSIRQRARSLYVLNDG